MSFARQTLALTKETHTAADVSSMGVKHIGSNRSGYNSLLFGVRVVKGSHGGWSLEECITAPPPEGSVGILLRRTFRVSSSHWVWCCSVWGKDKIMWFYCLANGLEQQPRINDCDCQLYAQVFSLSCLIWKSKSENTCDVFSPCCMY